MHRATFEELETRRLLTGPTAKLLGDISPGTESTEFHEFAAAGDYLYFRANDHELWRTDGTSGGTVEIAGIRADGLREVWSLSGRTSLVRVDLQGSNESELQLWQTDGTANGTRHLGSGARTVVESSDRFELADWSLVAIRHQQDLEIWRVSQNIDETALLMTLPDFATAKVQMTVQNDTVLATLSFGRRDPDRFLLQSDGTSEGTEIIATQLSSEIVNYDSSVFFVAGTESDSSLHRINDLGEMVTVTTWPGEVTDIRSFRDQLLVLRQGGEGESRFWELVISDGKADGTLAFRDGTRAAWPNAAFVHEFDGAIVFRIGSRLYRTDGTIEGTRFLFSSDGFSEIGGRYYGYSGFSFSPTVNYFTDGTRVFNAQTGQEQLVDDTPIPFVSPSLPPPPLPSFAYGDGYISLTHRASSNPGFGSSSQYFAPNNEGVLHEIGTSSAEPRLPFKVGDTWYIRSGETILGNGAPILSAGTRTDELQDSLRLFDTSFGRVFQLGPENDSTTWILDEDNQVRLLGDFELGKPDDSLLVGSTPEIGQELWMASENGSAVQPIDIAPGTVSSNPEFVNPSGVWRGPNIVVAETPEFGRELWIVEGKVDDAGARAAVLPIVHHHDEGFLQLSVELASDIKVQQISWDLNNDGLFDDAAGPNPNLSPQFLRELTPTITRNAFVPYHVRVETVDGQFVIESGLWRIDNRAPVFAVPTEIPTRATVGEEIQIVLNAYDDDELHYKVDFGDGHIVESDSSLFTHVFAGPGDYKIMVTVEDTHSSQVRYETRVPVYEPTLNDATIFKPGPVFGESEGTVDVRLWDSCGVGQADFIYTHSRTGEANMYFRLSDPLHTSFYVRGYCRPPERFELEDDSERMPLGDINGDEHKDFATIEDGMVQVWLGSVNAVPPRLSQQISLQSNYVSAADLDGDGDIDLVFSTNDANRIWIGDGTGQFIDSGQGIGNALTAHGDTSDLDGDGDVDIVFANGVGFGNTVWLNDGSATFVDSGIRLAPHWDTKRVELGRTTRSVFPDAVFAVANDRNRIFWNARNIPEQIVSAAANLDGNLVGSLQIEFDTPVTIEEIQVSGLTEKGWRSSEYGNGNYSLSADGMSLNWSLESPFVAGNLSLSVNSTIQGGHEPRQVTLREQIIATYDGDLDQDFDVDDDDFALLAKNYGRTGSQSMGDINGDGEVSFADFLLISNNYTGEL